LSRAEWFYYVAEEKKLLLRPGETTNLFGPTGALFLQFRDQIWPEYDGQVPCVHLVVCLHPGHQPNELYMTLALRGVRVIQHRRSLQYLVFLDLTQMPEQVQKRVLVGLGQRQHQQLESRELRFGRRQPCKVP
jgi:hypothetical protein